MNWRYATYRGDRIFDGSTSQVDQAVRTVLGESSSPWRISDAPGGLQANGVSGWHKAITTFQITPAAGGTSVSITLSVERLGPMGIVGWDAFGYYNGEIRKWLDGIAWHVNHGDDPSAATQRAEVVSQQNSRSAALLVGCPLAFLILVGLIYCIAAIVGLSTGSLYLASRGEGGVTIHGVWARVISALILAGITVLVIKILRFLGPGGAKRVSKGIFRRR